MFAFMKWPRSSGGPGSALLLHLFIYPIPSLLFSCTTPKPGSIKQVPLMISTPPIKGLFCKRHWDSCSPILPCVPWLHSIISSIFFLTHTSATFFLLDHLKLKIIQHDPSTWVFSFPSSTLDMKPALHFSGLPETWQTLPRVTDSTRPTIGDLTFSKMQLPLKMIYHNSRLSSWQMGRRGRLSEGPQKMYNLQSSIYSMFPWKWNATNKNIFLGYKIAQNVIRKAGSSVQCI